MLNSKYKKMPSRKGKYNEPYHEGLYRFQDQVLTKKETSTKTNNLVPIKEQSKGIKKMSKESKGSQEIEVKSEEDTYYFLGHNG